MNILLFLSFNLAGFLALFAGIFWGSVGNVFLLDSTGLTYLIGGWGLLAVLLIPIGCWRFVDYTRTFLVFLGLIGTVIGFMLALSGVSVEAAATPESSASSVASLISGLNTAFGTTLVGAVSSLWLGINKMLFSSD